MHGSFPVARCWLSAEKRVPRPNGCCRVPAERSAQVACVPFFLSLLLQLFFSAKLCSISANVWLADWSGLACAVLCWCFSGSLTAVGVDGVGRIGWWPWEAAIVSCFMRVATSCAPLCRHFACKAKMLSLFNVKRWLFLLANGHSADPDPIFWLTTFNVCRWLTADIFMPIAY